jgi:hypothetical protein
MTEKLKHSEKVVKAAVIAYLDAKKYLYIPIANVGIYDRELKTYRTFKGTKGAPDILVHIGAGVWYCLELKSTDGKQSKDQEEFEAKVEEKGGFYFIIRDINDLIRIGL